MYYVVNYYLIEKKNKFVTNGEKSINHDTNIQNFLIKQLQFRKAYCQLVVHYNIFFKIALLIIYPVARIIKNCRINNNLINRLLSLNKQMYHSIRSKKIIKNAFKEV